jgi:hypothetical protein
VFPQQVIGIKRKRFDQEGVDEHEYQDDDHRAYIDPSQSVRRNEPAYRFQNWFGQIVEDDRHRIERRNPHPGKNRPNDQNPYRDHHNDVEDF